MNESQQRTVTEGGRLRNILMLLLLLVCIYKFGMGHFDWAPDRDTTAPRP